ncbi:MAG TPA: hypothetical protein VF941_05080 [Clostridia bacterium]
MQVKNFVDMVCQGFESFEEEFCKRLNEQPGYIEVRQRYMTAVEDAGDIGLKLEAIQAENECYIKDTAYNEGFRTGISFAMEYLTMKSLHVQDLILNAAKLLREYEFELRDERFRTAFLQCIEKQHGKKIKGIFQDIIDMNSKKKEETPDIESKASENFIAERVAEITDNDPVCKEFQSKAIDVENEMRKHLDDEGQKLFLKYDDLIHSEAAHAQILLYTQALKDAREVPFI